MGLTFIAVASSLAALASGQNWLVPRLYSTSSTALPANANRAQEAEEAEAFYW